MANQSRRASPVVAISGGVGGAKLAFGLYQVLGPDRLTVLANTGDDFEHLGLQICPDLDTLMYTLAGINDAQRGWGRAEETWTFMQALDALGGETWFALGDGDLATHVERTRLLLRGHSLTAVTDRFCRRLGIRARLLPMSDDRVQTRIETKDEVLNFQDYFVRQACRPKVTGFHFHGADAAAPNPQFVASLNDADLAAVVICPSNPFISVDPVLAVPGVRNALLKCPAPVVAVSPIIGGKAVKGPTDKMMVELGLPVSTATIADHYAEVLSGLVVDKHDARSAEVIGVPILCTNTLMETLDDRKQLARDVLSFARRLRHSNHR